MKIFGYDIKIGKSEPQANAGFYSGYPHSNFENIDVVNAVPFDGEKTPYEMGTPADVYPDYYALRIRAWEAFLTEDIVQNAIKKYCLWLVGSGLKLQSEPQIKYLENFGITQEELKTFTEQAETQFRLFSEMVESVYSNEHNLHEEGSETLKNAIIAGDILCIARFDGKYTNLETIDGRHIATPHTTNHIAEAEARGNVIQQGIEIDAKGAHIAYYVKQKNLEFERIKARSKIGLRQAWLFYGMKFKKSDVRGMSLLTAVLETASMMDRYKAATLGSAEENAKIALTIEHNQYSDGSNVMLQQATQAFGKNKPVAPETQSYNDCESKATKIAQTTNKQVYNMPPGSSLKRHSGSTDSSFKEFFGVNIDIVYATLGIPPEVAQDKFGGAYSGSRAALKSWEYKLIVDRVKLMKRQYYKPFYDFWLAINVLQNNVTAPKYLEALNTGDQMIVAAYNNARFIGVGVPHIDPVKEVNAMRTKLGKMYENVPLDSVEKVMEELNSGDLESVFNKIENEKELYQDFISSGNTTGEPQSE